MDRLPEGSRAWVLLTLGEARQYGGNLGYGDDPTGVYRYDSFVPNHLRVHIGDLVVLRDRRRVLGCAVIESIEQAPSEKTRLSCPECDTTGIKERRTLTPRYRCNRGHQFEVPRARSVGCTAYSASFASTFVPARDLLAADVLRMAEIQSSDQLSIRAIDASLIAADARDILGLPALHRRAYTAAVSAEADPVGRASAQSDYELRSLDTRAHVLRAIRARQGQAQFRAVLRDRYGDACMITGCSVIDVVEAAHIAPYRGVADNHPDNGLLLRADLHTLFDLDILAIDPVSLVVHVSPDVRRYGYEEIEGRILAEHNQPTARRHHPRFRALGGLQRCPPSRVAEVASRWSGWSSVPLGGCRMGRAGTSSGLRMSPKRRRWVRCAST
jgi:hypothetical protein